MHDWIRPFGAHYALGVDGIGLMLVLLTAILTPVVHPRVVERRPTTAAGGVNAFFAWMLALEGLAIGVFAATDVFLFYVLFEATLIPIYFLIGGFGGPRRSYAAVKFLLFSLFGGLLMLASVVGLYVVSARAGDPSYLLSDLRSSTSARTPERWLFLGFFIAFAIKAPMLPVHTWLPDAAERGDAGHVGAAGQHPGQDRHLRDDPVLPGAVPRGVAVGHPGGPGAGRDQRAVRRAAGDRAERHPAADRLHLGVALRLHRAGHLRAEQHGQTGSMLYMFNHGLSTAALFLVTGFLISRRGSKLIPDFGGVEKVAPVLAGIFLLAGLSSLSLPGLSPFISEFLVLRRDVHAQPVVRRRSRSSASCSPRSTSC